MHALRECNDSLKTEVTQLVRHFFFAMYVNCNYVFNLNIHLSYCLFRHIDYKIGNFQNTTQLCHGHVCLLLVCVGGGGEGYPWSYVLVSCT